MYSTSDTNENNTYINCVSKLSKQYGSEALRRILFSGKTIILLEKRRRILDIKLQNKFDYKYSNIIARIRLLSRKNFICQKWLNLPFLWNLAFFAEREIPFLWKIFIF